jgi:hypothetical protein
MTLSIIDSVIAKSASYTSQELNESLPFFIHDGALIDRVQAKDMVLNQGKMACTIWLMDFSDQGMHEKRQLQSTLLIDGKQIPLWKQVSGKAIFIDEGSDFAISYNCIKKDSALQVVELDSLSPEDFNTMFQGVLKIQ